MGSDFLEQTGLTPRDGFDVVYSAGTGETSASDTRAACDAIREQDIDVLVFCGGDGTARDVHAAMRDGGPVVGIPSGVKMFSGVFALSPEAAAAVLLAYLDGTAEEGTGDVVDVDEDAYRRGELAVHLHGQLCILRVRTLIQSPKAVTVIPEEGRMQEAIADYVVELLEGRGHPLAVLGAGTTVEAVARRLGVEKTPLGVDLVRDGEVVVSDASETELLEAISAEGSAVVVVSPIGAQGFVLGRGSQQISPAVLEAAGGPAALMVIATPHKLAGLDSLLVDTGDPGLDARLAGRRGVIVGYHDTQIARFEAASAPGGES
jgi:predicted polyphosphate/ATP-dependent NAD kinase